MEIQFNTIASVAHITTSILALVFGTLTLWLKKGSGLHKMTGYLYFINMVILLSTAFMIYKLFGGFGVFHVAAIISGVTLFSGMLPVWLKKPVNKWLFFHKSFMYWSVLGLYMALLAEILTRIPGSNFNMMIFFSITSITILGFYCFNRYLQPQN